MVRQQQGVGKPDLGGGSIHARPMVGRDGASGGRSHKSPDGWWYLHPLNHLRMDVLLRRRPRCSAAVAR